MLGKRDAWALHLLFCALPKRAEVKSQGDWRIPRCMPTDRVSGVGEGHGSAWRDRCLCASICERVCMCSYMHVSVVRVHMYVFMTGLVPAALFKKTSHQSFNAQRIRKLLLMFVALQESLEETHPSQDNT